MKKRGRIVPLHPSPGRLPGLLDVSFTLKGMVRSKRKRDAGKKIPAQLSLTNKLNYERRTHYHNPPIQVTVIDRGLGSTTAAIVAECTRLTARGDVLSRSWLMSLDPALWALIPEDEKTAALDNIIDDVIQIAHQKHLEIPEPIPYSYVIHDDLDEYGRPRIHTHITLPGGIENPATGEFYELGYIESAVLENLKLMVNDVVVRELDTRLGMEWRLQIPEFAASYQSLYIPENTHDLNAWFPRELPASSPSDTIDSFGESDEISALIDSLFDDDFLEPIAKPRDPIAINDVIPAASDEGELAFLEAETDTEILPQLNWQHFRQGDKTLQIALESQWDDIHASGRIIAHFAWNDEAAFENGSGMDTIYQTSAFDHLFFDPNTLYFSDAKLDAFNAIETQLTALTRDFNDDFDQGMINSYKSQFQTMPSDQESDQNRFFRDVPEEWIRFDKDKISQGLERLPGIKWVRDELIDADLGLGLSTNETDSNGEYYLNLLIRKIDEMGIQQVKIIETNELAGISRIEDAAQLIFEISEGMETEFIADADVAHSNWAAAIEADDGENTELFYGEDDDEIGSVDDDIDWIDD